MLQFKEDGTPVEVTASATLTKGNSQADILLIECPTDTGIRYETVLHVSEVEPKAGIWSTIGQHAPDRAAASKLFDTWLKSYRDKGFVFSNESEPL